MKKLLSILLFISTVCSAQISQPNTFGQFQQFGSPTTWTRINGALYTFSGIVNADYADTTAANSSPIKNAPGAQIRTGSKLWLRNSTATGWVELALAATVPVTGTSPILVSGSSTKNVFLDTTKINITTTIAGLRANTTPVTTRYYTRDLGQEGYWYYDATDVTSADNTGLILVSSNGKRFKRIYDGAINVKWFGAKGDSLTNESAALQLAINSAPPASSLHIPAGIYKANRLQVRKPLTIYGDGTRTQLWLNDSATGANGAESMYLLRVDIDSTATYTGKNQATISSGGWNYGVTIRDIRLEGGLRKYHGSALWIRKTERSLFENIYIHGFDGPAVYLSIGARELEFRKVTAEFCGAWKTTGSRTQYPDLYLKKWTSGESFEAINDIKFFDWNTILPFWNGVEVNSIAATVGASSTTRFIKFFAPTIHGNAPAGLFSFYQGIFGMDSTEFANWLSVYNIRLFNVTGEADGVELHDGLFEIAGATKPHIHFENTLNGVVDGCRIEGKIDNLPDSTFAGILAEATGTNKIGSYTITNNYIALPATTPTNGCLPFKITKDVTKIIATGNQYNEVLTKPSIASNVVQHINIASNSMQIGTPQVGGTKEVLTISNVATSSPSMISFNKDSTQVAYVGTGAYLTGGTANDLVLRNELGDIQFGFLGVEKVRFKSNGRVGIGTPTPDNTLHLVGSLKFVDGNQGLNKLLTSDANGVATWQTNGSAIGTGTSNYVTKWTGTTTVGASQIYDDGTNVSIGLGGGAGKLTILAPNLSLPSNNDLMFVYNTSGQYRNGISNQFNGGAAASNIMEFKVSDATTTGQVSVLKLFGDGSISLPTAPATSAGTYDIVTINNTGVIEKVASSVLPSSGTYTPTPTNTTNVAASTAYVTGWVRSANAVTMYGKVDIDPTATGAVELRMSLPSLGQANFTNDYDAGGTAVCSATGEPVAISAVASAGTVAFKYTATSITNNTFSFSFTWTWFAP